MRFIILLIASVLFAKINVFVKDANITLNDVHIIKINDINDFKRQKGVLVLPLKDIEKITDKGLRLIGGIGEVDTYILTHKNLSQVKTVANANLPARIFFDSISNIKYVNATFSQFKTKKIDAYVCESENNVTGNYYNLKKLGITFNKYYILGDEKYIKAHKKEIKNLISSLNVTLNPSVTLIAYYYKTKLPLSDVYADLFKDFQTAKLKVAVTPYWPPFNFKDKGVLKGISIDFWNLIAKKGGLKYDYVVIKSWNNVLKGIKNGKYDIAPNTSLTEDRKKYAIFSKPYVKFPLAIACREDLQIDGINDIKSLAVGRNYTAYKMMKKHYPNLHYMPVKDVTEAIETVKKGKAECFVDIYPTVAWIINQRGIGYVKIFFKTDFTFKLRVMLRKDLIEVRDKVNDAIDNISETEKNKIIAKYIDGKLLIKSQNISSTFYYIAGGWAVVMLLLVLKAFLYKKKSEIDPLTEIYNRGSIEKIMKKSLKESDGDVLVIDIDHFKRVNDTYGHQKGDLVLKKLASIIKSNIRNSDVFGRWGGEEFVIILPKTSYEDGVKIAEKLRKIVQNSDFDGLHVTISVGVSDYKKGENYKDVFKRADEALYKAKSMGRNQVKGNK